MCEYCIEYSHALDILEKDVRGTVLLDEQMQCFCPADYFFLRESPDFPKALERWEHAKQREGLDLLSIMPPSVILYRGLEILVERGFESQQYQRLLRMPLYCEAIEKACDREVRNLYEVNATTLCICNFGRLYEAETYFQEERGLLVADGAHLFKECVAFLQHFTACSQLAETSYDPRFGEYGGTASLEYSFQGLIIRALLLSILVTGKYASGREVLYGVAKQAPAWLSGPEGDGLWLQRFAALKLYDLEGFELFRNHLTTLRATCYYYINLVRNFSREQKQMLLDEVRVNPEADQTDCNIVMSEWLEKELNGGDA